MIVSFRTHRNEWEVWVALFDGDPIPQRESFCIGVGGTADEAAASAVKALHQALDDVAAQARQHGAVVAK